MTSVSRCIDSLDDLDVPDVDLTLYLETLIEFIDWLVSCYLATLCHYKDDYLSVTLLLSPGLRLALPEYGLQWRSFSCYSLAVLLYRSLRLSFSISSTVD